MRARTLGRLLVAWAALLLGASYVWLAIAHGTPWLFPVIVHESGRHTFAGTVFYGRHFLREVPIAVLYAVSSVGAWRAYGAAGVAPGVPGVASRVASEIASGVRGTRASSAAASLLVAISFAAVAFGNGGKTALGDLLQAYTRDDLAAYGSHWRSHLLSSVAYLAAAVVFAALLGRATTGRFDPPRRRIRNRWIGGALGTMAVLTLIFRPTLEPFLDPRYVGHAAREAATHLAITLPLSFGVLLLAGSAAGGAHEQGVRPTRSGIATLPREVFLAGIAAAAILAFLGVATLQTGAVAGARPGVPLSSLVAAHAFEHVLDTILVVLLVLALRPADSASIRPALRGREGGA